LAYPWFDDIREECVDNLIRADRERKEQLMLQREVNGSGQTLKEKRGESSKSRASMRTNLQASTNLGQANEMIMSKTSDGGTGLHGKQ